MDHKLQKTSLLLEKPLETFLLTRKALTSTGSLKQLQCEEMDEVDVLGS